MSTSLGLMQFKSTLKCVHGKKMSQNFLFKTLHIYITRLDIMLILTLPPILDQSHNVWVIKIAKAVLGNKKQNFLAFLINFWPKTLSTRKTFFVLFQSHLPWREITENLRKIKIQISMICKKMCCMVISNLVISLVPYFLFKVSLLTLGLGNRLSCTGMALFKNWRSDTKVWGLV